MKTARPPQAVRQRRSVASRRGFTTPAVAIALLVTMAGLALILDRLWLDAADLELTTAAEAAALAAASELATDSLLTVSPDIEIQLDLARAAAAFIAGQNLVAGSPVSLDTSSLGDVRFGQLVLDNETNLVRFDETATNPTTAVVTALRTRRTVNPVGLFVAGVTGLPAGDVAARVEATIDNRVNGVRPLMGGPVPALPLAIWWKDPSGLRKDTWDAQIESRQGADQYGYDNIEHRVYSGSDGIPEMVLQSQLNGQPLTSGNVVVVDVGTAFNTEELQRQYASGWSTDDLTGFGGEFLLPTGSSQTLQASPQLLNVDREALESLIGQARICLLYSALTATDNNNSQTGLATCVRLVSVRVFAVNDLPDGGCQVVVQPCVVKTRTAIVNDQTPYYTVPAAPVAPTPGDAANSNAASTTTTAVAPNPYIYKLRLSH